MNGCPWLARLLARAVVAPTLLGLALILPSLSSAGILRDVMASVGLAKPEPPPSAAAMARGPPVFPRNGFACCDLHFDGDWINDGNYSSLPMIAAGTPVVVLKYGRDRAFVKVNGKAMRLGHDYGRGQESLDDWVNKIVVNDDPRPRIQGYPLAIQSAIRDGKVMVGMSREQAIAAIGYPLTSENASLDAPTWRLWHTWRGEYQLNFGADGRVRSITGEDEVTTLVTFRP